MTLRFLRGKTDAYNIIPLQIKPSANIKIDLSQRLRYYKGVAGVENLDEVEVYFTNLTPKYRFGLADKLATFAIGREPYPTVDGTVGW